MIESLKRFLKWATSWARRAPPQPALPAPKLSPAQSAYLESLARARDVSRACRKYTQER